jgi:glycerol-3-phosphate dehydrogenase
LNADAQIAVVGAGVVGAATALELARRGLSVVLLEAEPEPGLQASGTNSGIIHTGFDSTPGELETTLILRAAHLREPILEALSVPVLRCGAVMPANQPGHEQAIEGLAENAARNGVEVELEDDGALSVPGESVSDPVAFTLALVSAGARHGVELRTRFAVRGLARRDNGFVVTEDGGASVAVDLVVNCAGLGAGQVAGLLGDESFEVYPRKGEFLVFDPPRGRPPDRILLPVPSPGTKGILVFPTLDGKVVAGPTAADQEDRDDWSVRPEARAEILPKALRLFPALEDSEPVFQYAGLRPAGLGVNYVIGPSPACPGLVNVAAIRSTGLTASLAIAERVATIVSELGIAVRERDPLLAGAPPVVGAPWWRRTASHRGVVMEEDASA